MGHVVAVRSSDLHTSYVSGGSATSDCRNSDEDSSFEDKCYVSHSISYILKCLLLLTGF